MAAATSSLTSSLEGREGSGGLEELEEEEEDEEEEELIAFGELGCRVGKKAMGLRAFEGISRDFFFSFLRAKLRGYAKSVVQLDVAVQLARGGSGSRGSIAAEGSGSTSAGPANGEAASRGLRVIRSCFLYDLLYGQFLESCNRIVCATTLEMVSLIKFSFNMTWETGISLSLKECAHY